MSRNAKIVLGIVVAVFLVLCLCAAAAALVTSFFVITSSRTTMTGVGPMAAAALSVFSSI